jgi:hypothetical protein
MMNKMVHFSAHCATCGYPRPVDYNRTILQQLIASGGDIPAFCIRCDAYWQIDFATRVGLQKGLRQPQLG